jgi:hypothetical protein
MDKSGILCLLMLEEEEDDEILHLIFNGNGGNGSVHDMFKARSEEGLNTILINRHLMKDSINSIKTMSPLFENTIVVSFEAMRLCGYTGLAGSRPETHVQRRCG